MIEDQINKYISQYTDKVLTKLDKKADQAIYGPSKNTLDEFRAAISSQGGIQRLNQFIFNIPIPEFLRQSLIDDFSVNNFLSTQGLNIFDGTLGLLCRSVEIPPKQLNTSQIKINGQTRTVPMNYRWDNVTATFIDTNSCLVYNVFSNWLDAINNPVTNTGRFYDDYVKDLRLDYLNKNSEVMGYISLYEAFPIAVSRSAVSYDATNGYMTTTVTFSYLYQANQYYTANMLYNIANNVTGGVAEALLGLTSKVVDTYNPMKWVKNSMESTTFKNEAKENKLSLTGWFD